MSNTHRGHGGPKQRGIPKGMKLSDVAPAFKRLFSYIWKDYKLYMFIVIFCIF